MVSKRRRIVQHSSKWYPVRSVRACDYRRQKQPGLVLTSPWLVEDDVERGRLIQLFPHSLRTGKGYYLVYGKGTVLGPGAQDLYDWMMSCVPTSDWDVSDE